jgi:RHH-type transcriptional regulator, proline utilization regulon repressor / proline dehydrogenase / delta 1-pyrroline-5-carboxylate dehydrogenase
MTGYTETPVSDPKCGTLEPKNASCDGVANATVHLAAQLLRASRTGATNAEKHYSTQMDGLVQDEPGKAFTFAMVDEVFRSHRPAVQAAHWRALVSEYGVPSYFGAFDRLLIRAGCVAARFAPGMVMPLIENRMRSDSARVILDGEPSRLQRHLQRRVDEGFALNLNHLGEAVMGEQEATRRMEAVLQLLQQPHIKYVSVKISAIFSQINLIAWEDSLRQIKDRLRTLYRSSIQYDSFVNLDMEEYRDLELTLSAFCQVLDEEEFHSMSAGIVLQAYLPDSWDAQQRLVSWAKQRVAKGGAPVKLRLVKGANLAMEAVEAELHGWNAAPFATKAETDANFRRMLEYGCNADNARAVRLGVASHNLFDVALALVLRDDCDSRDFVEIEMLEGMANQQARVVRSTAGSLLLYAPTVRRQDFLSAMAYLVRRLDENTAPDNFLHDLFGLSPGSAKWHKQQQRFLEGWQNRSRVSSTSRRSSVELPPEDAPFANEPDSDWTQLATRKCLFESLTTFQHEPLPPLQDVDNVLVRAQRASAEWRARSVSRRGEILRSVAAGIATDRFDTVACLQSEARKAVVEADAEVSEAVDFARYYSAAFQVPTDVTAAPLGVVVVTPPWNFPYAIPCGGVLAALMAGNAVILKPAPEVTQTGWHLANQLWEAGVPRDVLQFFTCDDGPTGKLLLSDPRVDGIVLTGAWQTAKLFQSWRPDASLFAETSGKNAMVITAKADRELAVKDLVTSAFHHAGQKCSAASLAIIEAEVYDDPVFQRQLADAARSLNVGPAQNLTSVVTPTIQQPGGALKRGLTNLDDGERWLLQPVQPTDDPCLWTPGIRVGVQPGSWFHQNECFGPVLGLMRAADLDQAIEWQNAVDYGLTAGLHSLDCHEHKHWQENVLAGNLYINRPMTGAIVRRQPFGGWKRSSIGPGAKAGGPNYVSMFCRMHDALTQETPASRITNARLSYTQAWESHFSKNHDPSGLRCESNIFRYRPCRGVLLRLAQHDEADIERANIAANICGVPLEVSIAEDESDSVFANRLASAVSRFEFLRTVDSPSVEVLAACHDSGLNWINAPVTSNGQVELKYWLREQSISRSLHRYGQIPTWLPASRLQ